MRIALLQARIDEPSRAANMQHLMDVVDCAASGEPPPDVLLLPGACDQRGVRGGGRIAAGHVHAVRTSLAFKAREWGVFLAAGLHLCGNGGAGHAAVLFDPDGDLAARSDDRRGTSGDDRPPTNDFVYTGAGALTLIDPTFWVGDAAARSDAPGGAVCYLRPLTRCEAESGTGDAPGASATPGRAYRAAVAAAVGSDAASSERPGPSVIVDAERRVVARAESPAETIVYADLPIGPTTAAAKETDRSRRPDTRRA